MRWKNCPFYQKDLQNSENEGDSSEEAEDEELYKPVQHSVHICTGQTVEESPVKKAKSVRTTKATSVLKGKK